MSTYYRGRTKSFARLFFHFYFGKNASVYLFFRCCSFFCRSFFGFFRSVCCNSCFLDQFHRLGCQHVFPQVFQIDPLLDIFCSQVVFFCQTIYFCFQIFIRNFQLFQFCKMCIRDRALCSVSIGKGGRHGRRTDAEYPMVSGTYDKNTAYDRGKSVAGRCCGGNLSLIHI